MIGQTTPQVEKTIVEKLTGKAIEPQAIVTLSKNLSTSVTVGGEVVAGARVPLTTRGDRLLDVIATAGGIRFPANETFLELSRGGKTIRVPFQTLLHNPKENIYARPGDTLTVVRYPLSFTAVGATGRNAVVPFDAVGISLEEAIGKAAGLIDERADPEGVFLLRYEPVSVVRDYPGLTPAQAALDLVPVVYLINMRDPASLFLARKFSMHDKDIVYVSNSPYSDIPKGAGHHPDGRVAGDQRRLGCNDPAVASRAGGQPRCGAEKSSKSGDNIAKSAFETCISPRFVLEWASPLDRARVAAPGV